MTYSNFGGVSIPADIPHFLIYQNVHQDPRENFVSLNSPVVNAVTLPHEPFNGARHAVHYIEELRQAAVASALPLGYEPKDDVTAVGEPRIDTPRSPTA
jgi:hypothetical protein